MTIKFQNDWGLILEGEFEKEYYVRLHDILKNEYKTQKIYPDMHDIFNALHYTAYKDVKVVILGQDPYHGSGQAHGLSFSVKPDVSIPPSLMNIYKELHDDLGCSIPNHGHLKKWFDQGVLLLNAVLTVRAGSPASHQKLGWEIFTDQIIQIINQKKDPVVFVLWGKFAQSKEMYINNPHHKIIKSPHPSPFSANKGFFGSRPFSKANDFLLNMGETPIDWQIDPVLF